MSVKPSAKPRPARKITPVILKKNLKENEVELSPEVFEEITDELVSLHRDLCFRHDFSPTNPKETLMRAKSGLAAINNLAGALGRELGQNVSARRLREIGYSDRDRQELVFALNKLNTWVKEFLDHEPPRREADMDFCLQRLSEIYSETIKDPEPPTTYHDGKFIRFATASLQTLFEGKRGLNREAVGQRWKRLRHKLGTDSE